MYQRDVSLPMILPHTVTRKYQIRRRLPVTAPLPQSQSHSHSKDDAKSHPDASQPEDRRQAVVAMLNLDDSSFFVLQFFFKQYGIQSVAIFGDLQHRLRHEKFDACVLKLDDHAGPLLEAARHSRLNRSMVIYGIVQNPSEVSRYSQYSINAVLHWPLDRQKVNRVIRSTQPLVIHEFRRYVRVPITTEVAVRTRDQQFLAWTQEISSGGMSIKLQRPFPHAESVLLAFVLPSSTEVMVKAAPAWQRPEENLVGLRFEASDKRRSGVQSWIESYIRVATAAP
jgi:hypothetical protein